MLRARPSQSERLTRLAVQSKRHWGYPDHWIEAWRGELTVTPESISRSETWVAVRSDSLVGYYMLRQADDGLASLDHFWVLPSAIGQGVGSCMMAHVLERARSCGWTQITVVSDPNAEGFYLKHGAIRTGVERGTVCGQERVLPVLSFPISRG